MIAPVRAVWWIALVGLGCGPSTVSRGEGDSGSTASDDGGGSSGADDGGSGTSPSGDGGSTGEGSTGTTSATDTGGFEDEIERYVTELCEIVVGCECDPPFYSSVEECIEALLDPLLNAGESAKSLGLEWRQECADAKLERLAPMCVPVFDHSAHCQGRYCELFGGDVAETEPCGFLVDQGSNCAAGLGCSREEQVCLQVCGDLPQGIECDQLGSSCAEGLACTSHGIGFPPPPTCETAAGEGEECNVAYGPSCDAGLKCGAGTCVPYPEPGEPCVDGWCLLSLFCNEQDLCEPPRANGEPCGSFRECESGYCADEVCTEQVGEGAPCPDSTACAEGLVCNPESSTCEPAPPVLCVFWEPP